LGADSKTIGRTITYQDIPVGPWRDSLLKLGLPVHLVTMADQHRAGRFDRMSDDVLTLTGTSSAERAGVRHKECGRIQRVGKISLSVGGCSHSTHLTPT
jgi:hypothetical protein